VASGYSDDQLIERTRGGDRHAFGELYRRHQHAALGTARWLLRSRSEADDVVSDAFAGVLAAIRNGNGPRDNFRSYLLAAVRNGCRSRRQRTASEAAAARVDNSTTPVFEDPERYIEADTVARAFAALNPRWQQTLWLTEVEQRSAADVSEHLGLSPNATAALTLRAREAFATAYLAEHVRASPEQQCERYARRLATYVRDQVTDAQRADLEAHLAECSHCQRAVNELRDLNASLRTLAPLPGAGIAAPLTVGTSMGAVSTGLLSSGLLLKGVAAVLLIAPVLVVELAGVRDNNSVAR
jgi:RNA polymerase sigma factor (sigma-70 family)